MHELFKPLIHPLIQDGYMLSTNGHIKTSLDESIQPHESSYHSSNGYDYESFVLKDRTLRLFPIDELIALTFIDIPDELQNKRVTVHHINGNNRDNDIDNLKWIEDIEEWKTITYPGVKENMYEVSNWGRVRNKNNYKILAIQSFKGYAVLKLCNINNSYKHFKIHRLLIFEFSDDFDMSLDVNHIDGNPSNNNLKNLELCSHKDNMIHSSMMKLRKTKLNQDDVIYIWNLLTDDIDALNGRSKTFGSIRRVESYLKSEGKAYCTFDTIAKIKYKKHYSYITNNLGNTLFPKINGGRLSAKNSEDDIKRTCELLVKFKGDARSVLTKLRLEGINVSKDMINHIKNKRAWVNISNEFF